MALRYSLLLLVLSAPATVAVRPQGVTPAATQPRQIPLTRSLKIPVTQLTTPDQAPPSASSSLGIWPGATDELPEGPNGFDVLRDGSVVISDPLLHRVVVFNAGGSFTKAWPTDFAPDSITVTSDDLLLVRDAGTGDVHVFSRDGTPRQGVAPRPPQLPDAQVIRGQNTGTISSSTPGGTFAVHLDQPGIILLSLQPIARDPALGIFVALETTAPEAAADTINVRKIVRRYSPAGALLAETHPLPLDYFVPPVNELRVRNGVVYQLLTLKDQLLINEWDTNGK